MKFFSFATFVLVLLSSSVLAQTSINVPIGDNAYLYIDKLYASGLIKTPMYGQRPWTRDYVARMVKEALDNRHKLLDALDKETESSKKFNKRLSQKRFIDSILEELSKEYAFELQGLDHSYVHPLNYVSADYTYLNNDASPVPPDGLGTIDAVVHPLVENRKGTQYEKGQSFYLESEHSVQLSPYFAAYLKPQFQFRFPSNGMNDGQETYAYIQNLYAKTGWRDIEIEVGRDQLLWGEELHGGLMFSDNPRGLDMIKLSTPYPFRMPWVFKYLGDWKITAFSATLGPQQTPRYPILIGWRFDLSPWEWWNLALSHTLEMGGEGYALPKGIHFLGELFGYRDLSGPNTNHEVAFDFRFTSKKLRGTSLYIEGFIEDYNLRLLPHYTAWQIGVYLPRFDYSGKWTLRAEYEHIGELAYHHGTYASGWTLDRLILGNTIGPDSNKASTLLTYNFTPKTKIEANFSFIQRSSNQYMVTHDPDGKQADVIKTFDGPEEYHALNTYKLEFPINNRFTMNTSFGWDYVVNKGFVQGNKKADFLGEIGLKINFPEF